MTKPLYLLILSICISPAFGQSVFWADSLVNYSSFSTAGNVRQYGPDQVLGSPSKLPGTGICGGAWSPSREDAGEEFIHVGFKNHIYVEQIAIGENANPGSVFAVFLIDEAKQSHQVYVNEDPKPVGLEGRMFNIFIPRTTYKVASVKVHLNTAAIKGVQQIDAIAISDSKDSIIPKIHTIENPDVNVEKENLGTCINSKADELAPFISPDGNTLYFTRRFHPGNIGDSTKQDVWFARTDGKGGFFPAVNIGSPINNAQHNSASCITPDGQRMLILNTYTANGETSGKGLSMAHANGAQWDLPQTMHIENFYNENKYGEYSLSVSGKYLIMAVERDDSEGEKDLYISFYTNQDYWTEPKRMGAVINSVENETSPFIAADERSLYFSSKGFPGYGSNDVFVSYRLDDTWTNWSTPLNLGSSINTNGWDAYFTIPANGAYAYFVSNNKSMGGEDIWRQKLPESAKPKPVVLVSGRVLHNDTKQPLRATITYTELETGKIIGEAFSDSVTGEFKIILSSGKRYGILADKSGFFSVSGNLDLVDLQKYEENKKDILMVPIEVGSVTRLNNIFFDFDKATLRPESFPELDRLVNLLSQYSTMEIEIDGHTDFKGDTQYNIDLSKKRALTVVDYLISKGITQTRLTARGFGETKPITSEQTDEGRQLNRRVEFVIMKK